MPQLLCHNLPLVYIRKVDGRPGAVSNRTCLPALGLPTLSRKLYFIILLILIFSANFTSSLLDTNNTSTCLYAIFAAEPSAVDAWTTRTWRKHRIPPLAGRRFILHQGFKARYYSDLRRGTSCRADEVRCGNCLRLEG